MARRVSVTVRPSLAAVPPSAPIRFVEVGRARGARRRLGGLVARDGKLAASATVHSLDELDWPRADVVVLDGLREIDLSMASPDTPETLGWLLRTLDSWHVRLAVLVAPTPAEVDGLARAATAAAERGAGAFLVVAAGQAAPAVRELAMRILSDQPLTAASRLPRSSVLVVGAGRGGLLRLHHTAQAVHKHFGLAPMVEALRRQASARPQRAGRRVSGLRLQLAEELMFAALPRAGRGAAKAGRLDHPRDLFVRHSRAIADRAPKGLDVGRLVEAGLPYFDPDADRYLNAELLRAGGSPLARGTVLARDRSYLLALDVAPGRGSGEAVDNVRLLAEDLWRRGEDGAWVDLGVTGIDFDVDGALVQELWLPRTGKVEPRYFTVTPRATGLASLRYCLYRGNDVVQSFRLTAVVDAGERAVRPEECEALARALAVERTRTEGRAHAARLEYGLHEAASATPARTRALSIVANDLDDRPVFTIKGGGEFAVRTVTDVAGAVGRIRSELDKLSNAQGGGSAFVPVPGGLPAAFDSALQDMADLGKELFNAVVDKGDRDKVRGVLAEGGQAIHIAQVLLPKVIPWAVVYDRPFNNTDAQDADGNPVRRGTCHAPLAQPDAMSAMHCGQADDCLLRQGYDETYVACPLHFWGFRHLIEVPPYQSQDGESTPVAVTEVAVDGAVRVEAGVNQTFAVGPEHRDQIKGLAAPGRIAVDVSGVPAALREHFATQLDVAYFFGHASGMDDASSSPRLFLGTPGSADEGVLQPGDFGEGPVWAHHPLVFVNGCGTGAFSPAALSPFIVTFVDDLQAAGVLSTETAMWEDMASKVGMAFLTRFLDHQQAGEALLAVRRQLVTEGDPLAIAYTLHAQLELRLRP